MCIYELLGVAAEPASASFPQGGRFEAGHELSIAMTA